MNEPSFSSYTYNGAHQNAALRTAGPDGKPIVIFQDHLVPGKTYLMPDDHATVKGWCDLNMLTPIKGTSS
jgi:hypothetical protein